MELVPIFNILCIALGGASALAGVGVLVLRRWVLAYVRRRFDSVNSRNRRVGIDDVDPTSVPNLAGIIFVGVAMCVFAVAAISVGLTIRG